MDFCINNHKKTYKVGPLPPIPGFRVIDCATRKIEDGDAVKLRKGYVTLSYVWGPASELSPPETDELLLESVSRTIRNAMEVTLRLGFRYLWVDCYCIPQNRPSEKQALINHMGAIYQHSTITIIAVAGSSPTHGLPGVDGTPRTGQRHITVWQHSLVVGSMDGGKEIMQSEWNHRGWTFRESLLSSRKLIFTGQSSILSASSYVLL